jgi:hypothetical protein
MKAVQFIAAENRHVSKGESFGPFPAQGTQGAQDYMWLCIANASISRQ